MKKSLQYSLNDSRTRTLLIVGSGVAVAGILAFVIAVMFGGLTPFDWGDEEEFDAEWQLTTDGVMYNGGDIPSEEGDIYVEYEGTQYPVASSIILQPGDTVIDSTSLAYIGAENDDIQIIWESVDTGDSFDVGDIFLPDITSDVSAEFSQTESGIVYDGGDIHDVPTSSLQLVYGDETITLVEDEQIEQEQLVASPDDLKELGLPPNSRYSIIWEDENSNVFTVDTLSSPSSVNERSILWSITEQFELSGDYEINEFGLEYTDGEVHENDNITQVELVSDGEEIGSFDVDEINKNKSIASIDELIETGMVPSEQIDVFVGNESNMFQSGVVQVPPAITDVGSEFMTNEDIQELESGFSFIQEGLVYNGDEFEDGESLTVTFESEDVRFDMNIDEYNSGEPIIRLDELADRGIESGDDFRIIISSDESDDMYAGDAGSPPSSTSVEGNFSEPSVDGSVSYEDGDIDGGEGKIILRDVNDNNRVVLASGSEVSSGDVIVEESDYQLIGASPGDVVYLTWIDEDGEENFLQDITVPENVAEAPSDGVNEGQPGEEDPEDRENIDTQLSVEEDGVVYVDGDMHGESGEMFVSNGDGYVSIGDSSTLDIGDVLVTDNQLSALEVGYDENADVIFIDDEGNEFNAGSFVTPEEDSDVAEDGNWELPDESDEGDEPIGGGGGAPGEGGDAGDGEPGEEDPEDRENVDIQVTIEEEGVVYQSGNIDGEAGDLYITDSENNMPVVNTSLLSEGDVIVTDDMLSDIGVGYGELVDMVFITDEGDEFNGGDFITPEEDSDVVENGEWELSDDSDEDKGDDGKLQPGEPGEPGEPISGEPGEEDPEDRESVNTEVSVEEEGVKYVDGDIDGEDGFLYLTTSDRSIPVVDTSELNTGDIFATDDMLSDINADYDEQIDMVFIDDDGNEFNAGDFITPEENSDVVEDGEWELPGEPDEDERDDDGDASGSGEFDPVVESLHIIGGQA